MTEIKADPAVLDALSGLYKAARFAAELACRQKHRYLIKYDLKGLFRHFLCLLKCECCHEHEKCEHGPNHHEHHDHCKHGKCIPCWVRCVLNRIERLGGDADSTMDKVKVEEGIAEAFTGMIAALKAVCDAADSVIDAAATAKDHPSKEIASKIYHAADCDIAKFEALLRQEKFKTEPYVMAQIH